MIVRVVAAALAGGIIGGATGAILLLKIAARTTRVAEELERRVAVGAVRAASGKDLA